MNLFGGHQWKTLAEVKPHLMSKNTAGAGAGPVGFIRPGFHDQP
jgi:hypothetical protein